MPTFGTVWCIWSRLQKDGTNGLNPFIGFNAGNTTRAYEFFPYSQQPRVSQITEGGDEQMKGRYIFQVNEEIYTGTCVNWGTRHLQNRLHTCVYI